MPSGRWRALIGLGLVLTVVLAILAGPSRAQQPPISATQGHAQIVAQGVIAPPPDAVWRVVYRTIEPDAVVPLTSAGALILVDQGELLLRDEAAPWALLGQGEARQLPPAPSLRGEALDGRPAGFYEIALVAPAAGDDAGDGLPIFAGQPFAAPGGEHDLKLIRDILAPDEPTTITPVTAEAPTLVLATLGTIVVEAEGEPPVELRVGQAATVSGELTVRGAGLAPASFVAAVLGRALPGDAAGTPLASPAASPAATGASVTVRVHACPVGMQPGESNTTLCPADENAADLRLVAQDGAGEVDLGPPVVAGDRAAWTALPVGDYVLRAAGFGPGFDRLFVAGLAGVSGSAGAGYPAGPEGGYRIPVTDPTAAYQLEVFAFASRDQPPSPPAGTPMVRTTAVAVRQEPVGAVALQTYACPTVGLLSFDAAACALATPPYAVSLLPPSGDPALTPSDATAGADGRQSWAELPPGSYVLRVPLLPAGTVAYFVAETAQVTLLPDGTGYAIAVAADAPVTIDLYTVGPEPAPPTVAATVAPTTPPEAVDTDGDGLPDVDEVNIHGTDPSLFDTDGDGIGDGDEIAAGTDPFTPGDAVDTGDLDSDGLADVDEAAYGTDPNNPDTDGDGWLDGNEVLLGTNPLDPASFPESP